MTDATRRERPDATSRRDLARGLGAGLTAAAAASLLPAGRAIAQPASGAAPAAGPAAAILRTIPRTEVQVPAIGLGTFMTFDRIPGADRGDLKEVVRTYWEAGARVVDTSPLYGTAEYSVGSFVSELGIADRAFVSNKIWSTGEYLADESHAWRSLQQSMGRLWRRQIDVMHCHSLTNVDPIIAILQAWKREGHVRFVGVTHHENLYHDAIASWMERGAVDLVQVNYSIFNRAAENRLLPIAADRGIGVMVNMPLEKARLHKVVGDRPLPDFAREFGARTWAQFFLKWVIAHPAVTCALPATANPAHARDNVGALAGPLPTQAMRRRMVEHMETIPGFRDLGRMPWYPDKTYAGVMRRAQGEVRARAARPL